MEITLTTPALLFSATSLIVLAYTNRFLSLANLVRNLHDKYMEKPSERIFEQIKSIRRRLHIIRTTQILGLMCLLLSVVSMCLIYIRLQFAAELIFGLSLLLLCASLMLSIWEINISTKALDLHLSDMEEDKG